MEGRRRHRLALVLALLLLTSTARSDLVISRCHRIIENKGPDDVFEVLLAFPHAQTTNLGAGLRAVYLDHAKQFAYILAPKLTSKPKVLVGLPSDSDMTFYSVSLPKILANGKTLHMDVLATFTHSVKPFPEEITQYDSQLVLYTDTVHYISPYPVKYQSVEFMLPGRVEYYTKYPNVILAESVLRYGPFEEQPAFSYSPVFVHYENNKPFAVASEMVREIEISHWGNVMVHEQYTLFHAGARLKNGSCILAYQMKPYARRAPSLRTLVARFPHRAHSVYYRDEIGNISTSYLSGDSQKTQLEIELRFPLFGGWKTLFTLGYSLPLQDFLSETDGDERVFDLKFGCPIGDLLVEKHIVKVVLPVGSKKIRVVTPCPTKKSQDVKYSHLDIVGRPVVVMEMDNVAPEYNANFLVYYKFNNMSLLRMPAMLIFVIFVFFVTCIVYMHTGPGYF